MVNKLPEKLTLLRKHYGYSQGDIANKLHIPVTEYMNWENGNSICGIQQLKVLADLFHISLDAMADNSKDIVIPEGDLGDSVNIPFLNGAGASMTQQMDVADNIMPVSGVLPADTQQQTLKVNTVNPSEDLGSTRTLSTVSKAEESAPRQEAKPPVKKIDKQAQLKKKKKKTMILVGSLCAAAVIIVVILIVVLRGGSSLTVGTVNRLAEGDKYTLYVDKNGKIQTYGTFDSSSTFKEAVQVSAYGNHAVALEKSGTVITNNGDSAVAEWKNIIMIAAGKQHTVGLKKDGTVVCSGDTNACSVGDWTDITAVYAGNGVTIGLVKDGSLVTSGSINSAVSNQKEVASISMNDNILTLTKKDGKVSSYAIGSKPVINASTFSDITSTAVGTDAVIGLKKDGTVSISTSDTTLQTAVSGWSNIAAIAAYDKTYVAVDKSGKLYGTGDNTYSQYQTDSAATASAVTNQLTTPKNVITNLTTANLSIKWDAVDNADYYKVTVTGKDVIKAANNSTSIAVTEMEDGKEYTISVVACSNKPTDYPDSEAATIKYTYKTLSKKLDAPANIRTSKAVHNNWTIAWDAVDNADYYMISLDGGTEVKTSSSDPSYTFDLTVYTTVINGTTHNIAVTAYSNSTAYTQSDTTKATNMKYSVSSSKITINFVTEDKKTSIPAKGNPLLLEEGEYSVSTFWDKTRTDYSLKNPDQVITVSPNTDATFNITIIATSGLAGN